MKKISILFCLSFLASSLYAVEATTAATPATPTTTAPVVSAGADKTSKPVTPVVAPEPPKNTLEQRHQQELLANAQRIDDANRNLLAKNQELALQIESLALQNKSLKHQKGSEGMTTGFFITVGGFLLGWFFASRQRKNQW